MMLFPFYATCNSWLNIILIISLSEALRVSWKVKENQLSQCRSAKTRLNQKAEKAENPIVTNTDSDDADTSPKDNYVFKIVDSIKLIEKSDWNALINPESCSPFLKHTWLSLLEETECASVRTGWQSIHLLAYRSDNSGVEDLVLAIPLYIKYHSQGEFIFDHPWAEFAESVLNIPYYPKILSAVPFTPSTGQRLLMSPHILQNPPLQRTLITNLLHHLKGICEVNRLSGVHVNFMPESEVGYFTEVGFDHRQTIQYRWQNYHPVSQVKYKDFDDYLSTFKSKKRTQIKSERRKVKEQGIEIKIVRGNDPLLSNPTVRKEFFRLMYEIYCTTVDKMFGTRYLTLQFFERLSEAPADFLDQMLFVLAIDNTHNYTTENDETDTPNLEKGWMNRIVAGTINFCTATHFSGRYWGNFQPHRTFLHFEICYYAAIEYCINTEIDFMEPGAGGGEFKYVRGFDPYVVHSVHYLASKELRRAVGVFLADERRINQEIVTTLKMDRNKTQ